MKSKFPRVVIRRGWRFWPGGCALRLRRAGFTVALTEVAQPLRLQRRTVSLAHAVLDGSCQVEEVVGRCRSRPGVWQWPPVEVPVVVDPAGQLLAAAPSGGRRRHHGQTQSGNLPRRRCPRDRARPRFHSRGRLPCCGRDRPRPFAGTAFRQGSALPDSGEPGEVAGRRAARVLRAPQTDEWLAVVRLAILWRPGISSPCCTQTKGPNSPSGPLLPGFRAG
jgi:xanthine dehydrogenase accessory factor